MSEIEFDSEFMDAEDFNEFLGSEDSLSINVDNEIGGVRGIAFNDNVEFV